MTRTNQFRADFIVCQTLVVLPFTVHFPDCGSPRNSRHTPMPISHSTANRNAAPLPSRPRAAASADCPRFGSPSPAQIRRPPAAAQKISQRDGEELKGIPGGKDPPLNFRWDVQAVDGVRLAFIHGMLTQPRNAPKHQIQTLPLKARQKFSVHMESIRRLRWPSPGFWASS